MKFVIDDQILVKNKARHTLSKVVKLVNVTLIFLSLLSMNSTIYIFEFIIESRFFKDWFRNNIILIYKKDFLYLLPLCQVRTTITDP